MMVQPVQPDLVKSATDDDDNSSASGKGQDKALEYLLRYETMVRQQEAEDMATLSHIRPILKRIEKLSGQESGSVSAEEDVMAREVTFVQLEKALEALELNSSEVMTTDRQLMLVLRTLTKKSPETEDECISWAEFYQCYKIVVTGMQTLQCVPSQSLVRSRTKDRTLSILSMFESPSTKLFNEDVPLTIHTNDDEALEGDRHYIPEGLLHKRKRNLVYLVIGGLFAATVLFLSSFVTVSDGTPTFGLENAVSQVKETVESAKAIALEFLQHEALVLEKTTSPSVSLKDFTPRDMISEKVHQPSAVKHVSNEDSDESKALTVLAGASGVAVAPLLFAGVTFLQTATGLGAVGVLSLFTLALAPILNGLDIVFEKMLRALGRAFRKK